MVMIQEGSCMQQSETLVKGYWQRDMEVDKDKFQKLLIQMIHGFGFQTAQGHSQ